MELVCVRHGRTAWNAQRRFQGHTDVPLDDEGRAQAQALAVHLAGEQFDRAVCSDLTRAATTADIICAPHGIVAQRDARLREMRFGNWEGLTWDEIVARDPHISYAYEQSPREYTPVGGETFDALVERITPAVGAAVAGLASDARVIIVSHAGVMHALVRVLTGVASEVAFNAKFSPASVMRVSGLPGSWQIDAFNETAPVPA